MTTSRQQFQSNIAVGDIVFVTQHMQNGIHIFANNVTVVSIVGDDISVLAKRGDVETLLLVSRSKLFPPIEESER